MDCAHLATTYTALCTLRVLGDDFSRLDRAAILSAIKHLQQPDGRSPPSSPPGSAATCIDRVSCGACGVCRAVCAGVSCRVRCVRWQSAASAPTWAAARVTCGSSTARRRSATCSRSGPSTCPRPSATSSPPRHHTHPPPPSSTLAPHPLAHVRCVSCRVVSCRACRACRVVSCVSCRASSERRRTSTRWRRDRARRRTAGRPTARSQRWC
jgi:hypothetical protein